MSTLGRISVTPVKGTALQHPERVELTSLGIVGNRRFHLVDDRGALRSGYDEGSLVQVVSDLDDDGTLRCTFPDGSVAEGPTDLTSDAVEVDFDDRWVEGHTVEGPFDAAFSRYLDRPVRLVKTDREGDGSDVHRLTLLSFASVAELGRRGGYGGDLDGRRFRLNLELDDAEPFEEDTWSGRDVRIGEAIIQVLGPVPRCRVTNQNPVTGAHDWSTLSKIASFRPLMPGPGRGIPFGVYAECRQPGIVRLGDAVVPG